MKQNTFSMLDENGVEVFYDVLFTFESDEQERTTLYIQIIQEMN